MTLPLWGLTVLSILALVHVSIDSFLLKLCAGNAWTAGPRDRVVERSMLAGRARRALVNFLETAPVFISLALVVELSGLQGPLIAGGLYVYLAGRALYLPAYLSGVPYLRTAIWLAATSGLAAMLAGILLA
ncbi:MAPEG family protein [Ruegeria sp. MALMAid1280]|uniref:MAPEG family protein n=1 Tax=Ruegeria sp. MALMAid1280 TaxID=3411634 RepID=UPI003BA3BEAB